MCLKFREGGCAWGLGSGCRVIFPRVTLYRCDHLDCRAFDAKRFKRLLLQRFPEAHKDGKEVSYTLSCDDPCNEPHACDEGTSPG